MRQTSALLTGATSLLRLSGSLICNRLSISVSPGNIIRSTAFFGITETLELSVNLLERIVPRAQEAVAAGVQANLAGTIAICKSVPSAYPNAVIYSIQIPL